MIIIIRYRRRRMLGNAPKKGRRAFSVLGAVAAVTVPAHGFVIDSHGLVSSSVRTVASPLKEWLRRFAGACLWASAIAAGLIIYQHFTTKWKNAGYPVIPISALAAIDQAVNTGSKGPAIPLGPGGGSAQQNREANKRQTSFLEALDFEG